MTLRTELDTGPARTQNSLAPAGPFPAFRARVYTLPRIAQRLQIRWELEV